MVGLFLSLLLAQAAPAAAASAAPAAALLDGWTAVKPILADEYQHYARRERDGTDSVIFATRRVCDCQVDYMVNQLNAAFMAVSHGAAKESITELTICGRPAKRLLATALATPDNTIRNTEITAFRDRDALVVIMYSFRYADPMPDAEAAQAALCPPVLI
jgi:hypothetical protein